MKMNEYISEPKHETSYKREIPAFIAGLVILVITALFIGSGALARETYEDTEQWMKIVSWLAILSLIVRLFAANWVARIARRQNRRSVRWSWVAFAFPGITLSVIGLLGKKELTLDIDQNLPPRKQSARLGVTANELYISGRYPLSIDFASKAIEIDPENNKCREVRAMAYYHSGLLDESEKDFEKLRDTGFRLGKVYLFLGNIELKKGDFEKAAGYWSKARIKGNGTAKHQMNRYWNYRGRFILKRSDLKKKLYKPSGRGADLKSVKYKKGMEEIDNFLKTGNVKIRTSMSDLGLIIRFRKFPKSLYIGANYLEIEELSVNIDKQEIYMKLTDKNRLWLDYYPYMDRRKELETLKKYYSAATGK